jgi:hypothetical protein
LANWQIGVYYTYRCPISRPLVKKSWSGFETVVKSISENILKKYKEVIKSYW